MKNTLILGCILLLYVSCYSNNNSKKTSVKKDSDNVTSSNTEAYETAYFAIAIMGEEYIPYSITYVVINDHETKTAKVVSTTELYNKIEYSSYDVLENGIDVYKGWNGERQETTSHHWKKKISL